MNDLFWNNQKIALIASKQDIASITIAEQVEKIHLPVYYLQDKSFLHASDDDLPLADNYIFLSRHSSSAGEPAFTVHSVGNYSPDTPRLGGKPATLGRTQGQIQTYLLYSLAKVVEKNKKFSHFASIIESIKIREFYIEMNP